MKAIQSPKFSMLDNVQTVPRHESDEKKSFVIGSVKWNGLLQRYEYGSLCGDFAVWTEESLELYQPDKIRLYAYRILGTKLIVYMLEDFSTEILTRCSGLDKSLNETL